MNRLNVWKLVLAIAIFIPLVEVGAQNEAISSDKFNAVKNSADSYLKTNSYSSTHVSEWRDTRTSKITTRWMIENEVISPSRSRKRVQHAENGKTSVVETILIDSTRYTSKDNGDWTVSQNVGTSTGMEMQADAVGAYFFTYRDTDPAVGQSQVYVMERLSKYQIIGERIERIQKHTLKIWIGNDGQYLKVVSKLEGGSSGDNLSVTTYQYPKNLKIEAPIK